MAYVNVPKDLTKIKSKVLFNLDKAATYLFWAGGAHGSAAFLFAQRRHRDDGCGKVMIVVMLPGFLFGVYEEKRQPLEVVGRQIIESCFLRPKERPYQTVNAYDALVCQYQMEQEVKAIVEKSRQRGSKSMADKPKLTRAERKQIEAVIRKYRGDGKPHTAQDTIPYQIMYPDGICYLGNRRYSQSIEFFDINYLLAQPDDQTAIFEYLCDLYNYLDSSIHVQFTYPNRKSDREQLARSFEMPPCNDGLDPIRRSRRTFSSGQLARGNNGSVKTKYITYTIEADNLKAARARAVAYLAGYSGLLQNHGCGVPCAGRQGALGGAARHHAPGWRTLQL